MAAKRLSASEIQSKKFMPFVLSASDAMMAGVPFEGRVLLTARIDGDSDPLTKGKGDWEAIVETEVGRQKVSLELKPVQE